MVVADQPKRAPLREDGRLVIQGAIPKAKDETRDHLAVPGDHDEIAGAEDLAFERFYDQKSMAVALNLAGG